MDREAREFWRRQRRAFARRRQAPFFQALSPTTVLLGAIVLVYLVATFAPGLFEALAETSLGPFVLPLISALFPGSLIGLLFLGLFVYVLGRELEPLDHAWKLFLVFLLSGAVSAFLVGRITGAALVPSFSGFGLAGAYAASLMQRGGLARTSAYTWVFGLLLLNAFLAGFRPVDLLGMVSALAVGFALAEATGFGAPF